MLLMQNTFAVALHFQVGILSRRLKLAVVARDLETSQEEMLLSTSSEGLAKAL